MSPVTEPDDASSPIGIQAPSGPAPPILCVVDSSPVPPTSGGVIRLNHLLRALANIGPISLLVLTELDEVRKEAIRAEYGPIEITCASVRGRRHITEALRELRIRPYLPFTYARRDYRAAQAVFDALGKREFALTFFSSQAAWSCLSLHAPPPHVVNLNDVLSRYHVRLARTRARRLIASIPDLFGPRRSNWLAGATRLAVDGVDLLRWKKLETQIVGESELVVVPSPDEVTALDAPNVQLIPNGASEPIAAIRTIDRYPKSRRLVFPANFRYEPNSDGAFYFIDHVLPIIRQNEPDVEVVLAGNRNDTLDPLATVPGVSVTGFLEDFEEAWHGADVAIVPLRVGGGTRLKILEAWARQVPVVSTRLGAEGLNAVSGEHLLLADSAPEFARACLALLGDPALRRRLAANGYQLFRDRYRWSSIEAQFAELTRQVLHPQNST